MSGNSRDRRHRRRLAIYLPGKIDRMRAKYLRRVKPCLEGVASHFVGNGVTGSLLDLLEEHKRTYVAPVKTLEQEEAKYKWEISSDGLYIPKS